MSEIILLDVLDQLEASTPAAWSDEQLRCALVVTWTRSLEESTLPRGLTVQMLRRIAGTHDHAAA